MRVLLDTCVWAGARAALEASGHEVTHAAAWIPDPGDDEILARAHGEGRVLVTLDKDFGELAILKGARHSGIIRLVGIPVRDQGRVCVRILSRYGVELSSGALITADPQRVRIRPAQGEKP